MKVVALVSGGKDSCFNMMHAVANGHDIVALANLRPPSAAGKDELDSYMFQTVGHDVLDLYTECMGLPLFRQDLVRSSVETGADYAHNEADEVEDLYQLLLRVKESVPGVEAVSSGAILSNYQRVRIENVCARLGLTSLAFMWQGQQAQLLQGMIENGIEAILIKVAAIGLKEIHLGRTLAQMSPILDRLNAQFGINVCGEGGEYETLTLDCPLFKKRIVIVESEKQVHSYNDMAPVAYFKVLQTRLEPKPADGGSWIRAMQERIRADSMALADDAVQAMVLAHKTCTQSAASTVLAVDAASSSIDPNANFEPTVHWSPPFFAISGVTAASLGQALAASETASLLEKETEIVAEYIISALAKHGQQPQHLTQVHVHVADMSEFAALNRIYKTYFGHTNPATRVTVQSKLPRGARVQMDCFAVHDPSRTIRRDTLHVQGISYWAPANIGPYSQAVQIGDHLYLAGQIGLVPHTMQLPDSASHPEDALADIAKGDPILAQLIHEASVSLRSLAAVPDALGANLAEHCVACVCYVSDSRFFAAARAAWEHSIDMASCKPPALFVAVQQLPRGALVEWEALVGHERGRAQLMQARVDSSAERDDDDDDNDDEHGESSRGFGWDADGQTVVSDVATGNGVACHSSLKSFGSFIGAATSVSLDHSNDALAFSDVVLLANTLVGGLRSIMSKWQQQTRSTHDPWPRVFSIRVFHLASIPDHWVSSAVQEAVSKYATHHAQPREAYTPAITKVTVDALPGKQILAGVLYASLLGAQLSESRVSRA